MTGAEVYIDRIIGAIGGALIAPALIPPGTWFPLRRTLVSLLSGFMLEPIPRHYLGWQADADSIIAAACIVSTISWWTWHAVIRMIEAGWIQSIFSRKPPQP